MRLAWSNGRLFQENRIGGEHWFINLRFAEKVKLLFYICSDRQVPTVVGAHRKVAKRAAKEPGRKAIPSMFLRSAQGDCNQLAPSVIRVAVVLARKPARALHFG
jgi:hypothetical protein